MSKVILASDFCRLKTRVKVPVYVVDEDETSASVDLLRQLGVVAKHPIWLNDTLCVRVHARRDTESTLRIPRVVALNLNLVSAEDAVIVQTDRTTRPCVAARVTFHSYSKGNNDDTSMSTPLPQIGTLLQPDVLICLHNKKDRCYYRVHDIHPHGEKVYITNKDTHFLVESPQPLWTAPKLPPFPSSLIPHPDVQKFVDTIASIPPTAPDRLLHVVGTDDAHHVTVALEVAAAQLGRYCTVVKGLAAADWSNCSHNGRLPDKLHGLEHVLQTATTPGVVVIHDMDQEWHDENDAARLMQTLSQVLATSRNRLTTRLPQVPTLVVVWTTSTATLPASIQNYVVYPSIHCVRPDAAYIQYLWNGAELGRESCLQGREAEQIISIRREMLHQVHDNSEETARDVLERICQRYNHKVQIPCVQWEDVGGLAHVRQEILQAITFPLQYPHLFPIAASTGILLYGPPGTGKTLVAKAVATECRAPFISVKGPELLGSYVGESEASIRQVFEQARQLAEHRGACVVFLDELDSLAPRRGQADSGGNVMDRVTATLLAELDRSEARVICLGATNRPDLLDPALLRPGRLSRRVYLGVDPSARWGILHAQLRRLRLDQPLEDVCSTLVQHLPANVTGADLSTIPTGGLIRATERLCKKADEEAKAEHVTVQQLLDNWEDDQLEPIVLLTDLMEAAKELTPSVSSTEMDKYNMLQEQFVRMPSILSDDGDYS